MYGDERPVARWVDPLGRDLERVRRDAGEAFDLATLLNEVCSRAEQLDFAREAGGKFFRRLQLGRGICERLGTRDREIAEELELLAADERAWRARKLQQRRTRLRRERE